MKLGFVSALLAAPLACHRPKLPGLGEIDRGRFFSGLGDVDCRGPGRLEAGDRACADSVDLRKASLRQSGGFLKNFLPV